MFNISNWFKTKEPEVKFLTFPELKDVIPPIDRAEKFYPDWFKKLSRTYDCPVENMSGHSIDIDLTRKASTVKSCVPFREAIGQGFMLPMWCDLLIKVFYKFDVFDENKQLIDEQLVYSVDQFNPAKYGEKVISYENRGLAVLFEMDNAFQNVGYFCEKGTYQVSGQSVIDTHDLEQVGKSFSINRFACGNIVFKMNSPWIIEAPKGWSMKLQPVANDWSHDIIPFSGIVDFDTYYNFLNMPFFWAGNETGEFLIKRGTPIAQLVFFPRTEITGKVGLVDPVKYTQIILKIKSVRIDGYKRFYWNKRREK